MITKTIYRKKLALFLFGVFFLLCIAYAFGFRKTINAREKLVRLREQSEIVSQSSSIEQELEIKLNELNACLGDIQVIDDDQEFILSTVNSSAERNKLRVIEITGTASQTDNGIVKSTYGATVEGSFADLVRLVRAFEESGHEGNIASTSYFRYVDKKSKRAATRLKFYIQEYRVQ